MSCAAVGLWATYRRILLVLLTPAQLWAQSAITGRLVDERGGAIQNAIVGLRAADEAEHRSSPTDAGGRFRVNLAPGTYVVHVYRIGYAPFRIADVRWETTAATSVLVWRGTAALLAQMEVRDRRTCDLMQSSESLLAIWQQIRTALTIAEANEKERRLEFERNEYRRVYSPSLRVLESFQSRGIASRGTTSYRAAHPESLAVQGYVVEDQDGTTFRAPSAATLLSQEFLGGHCFMLRKRTRVSGTIAVDFEPAKQRQGQNYVDIAGTYWLDAKSSRLDSVLFQYVGLPAFVSREQANGAVAFAHSTAGDVFVSRWAVRMPRIGRRATRSADNLRRTTFALETRQVEAVEEEAGVVTRVMSGADTLFTARASMIALRPSRTAEWLAMTKVQVVGTSLLVPLDASSASRIDLPSGRYELQLTFPFDGAKGLPVGSVTIEEGGNSAVVTIPSDKEISSHLCRADVPSKATAPKEYRAALWGVVVDSTGRSIGGASVLATWYDNVRLPSARPSDRLSATRREASTTSGADGYFLLCALPATDVLVNVSSNRQRAESPIKINDQDWLVGVNPSRLRLVTRE